MTRVETLETARHSSSVTSAELRTSSRPAPAGGWLYLPREYVRQGYTALQLGVLVALLERAKWKPESVRIVETGEIVTVDRGEALYGEERLAAQLRTSRSAIRKAVLRFEADGIACKRAATQREQDRPEGLPDSRFQGQSRSRPRGRPPTILRFVLDRDFIWLRNNGADGEADSGADLRAEAAVDTGAVENKENPQNQVERRGPLLFPSQPSASTGAKAEPLSSEAKAKKRRHRNEDQDPRHKATVDLLVRIFREERGAEYAFQGRKDGAAVKAILAFPGVTEEEIEARWRHALRLGSKYPGCSSIAELRSKWNNLTVSAGDDPGGSRRPSLYRAAPSSAFKGGRLDF